MWIEIFKTGKHTDMKGVTVDVSNADLEKMAKDYDPSFHEAPVVIGHPKEDAPAYGWVEKLQKRGDRLLAKTKDEVPEFIEAVKKGLYKKISAAFYQPGLRLRHVGFLGAVPPAIKGLAPVSFAEGESREFEMQFMDDWQQSTVKGIFQRLREWIIEKSGIEAADKVIPLYEIDALQPREEKQNAISPSFSEEGQKGKGGNEMSWKEKFKAIFSKAIDELPEDPAGGGSTPLQFSEAEVKTREEKAAKKAKEQAALEFAEAGKQREKELKDREAAIAAKEKETKKAEIVSFVEGLKKEGKVIPAMEKVGAGITSFLIDLSTSPGILEFKEGEETKTQTPLEFIRSFLSGLPKQVEFAEVATRDKDTGGKGNAGEKLSVLTRKKMEANKKLSYNLAFSEVQRENPDLAKEYEAEIRPGT